MRTQNTEKAYEALESLEQQMIFISALQLLTNDNFVRSLGKHLDCSAVAVAVNGSLCSLSHRSKEFTSYNLTYRGICHQHERYAQSASLGDYTNRKKPEYETHRCIWTCLKYY